MRFDLVEASLVYREMMPSEEDGFKQCVRQRESTLERIEKMKYEALLRGQFLTFSAKGRANEKMFVDKSGPEKEGLTRIKAGELKPLELKT